jgi:hypothetical protein
MLKMEPYRAVESWTFTIEPWGACRTVVNSHHFDVEQDPDPDSQYCVENNTRNDCKESAA